MKNRIALFLVAVAAVGAFALSSCHIGCIKGSGTPATETRQLGNFSKIDISGGFKVTLKQDTGKQLTVTTDDNLMKYIRTEVSGDKLRIYTRKNICNDAPIVVNLNVKSLSEVVGAGAIELLSDGRINTQNLKLQFSGANKINLDLSAADLLTQAKGVTEINLKGQAASHNVEIAGTAQIKAFDFVAGKYVINAAGDAECEINVLKSLEVNSQGASNIKYRGNPTDVKTDKAGAASVKKVN
ncbi:head GIN domain-containing protein [Mucilaginibacter aquatilis]|uniref:Putative auto-transporter adhesin head GIN domain-containing protein n=1 Tax=Mucilaginibacter aquatilis TaxID=1517760 RepID=A0A6I4I8W7_9SPHI|nr:head GIN domain-containing protein [Mucilaginibacter aquatilis]MVN89886.1 hypothetical protein [Mucilaginibacter aquatilis]